MTTQADFLARAKRLRLLMAGPFEPAKAMAGIQEIVNERIADLSRRFEATSERINGSDGGSEPKS